MKKKPHRPIAHFVFLYGEAKPCARGGRKKKVNHRARCRGTLDLQSFVKKKNHIGLCLTNEGVRADVARGVDVLGWTLWM